ncbi:MAG: hypothetical protein JRN26_02895 [Nitrososphaerota archaeon]|nr:hypothetical protein [Nitrososphaerota archaeon]MDG6928286.1 hypothetical protein [Nitrososphaerota archaeon]MDG6931563.1 hypothetical protein [Nitrososphaerota archaeon]MDG6935822.1 hypothetical protein [Nitrososphaerota archaeon]MDG6943481.1 hypothetical protein [Nitrososphaerota archaeon]
MSRFPLWTPPVIVAASDFIVTFSIFYFVPNTSSYIPLYFIVYALISVAAAMAYFVIRSRSRKLIIKDVMVSGNLDEDYRERLRQASEMFMQGKMETEDQFFTFMGQRTDREEKIFSALKESREKLEKKQ